MKRKQNDAIGLVKRVISGDKDAIKEVLASIPRLVWKPSENCLPLEDNARLSDSKAFFSPDISEYTELPEDSEQSKIKPLMKPGSKEYLKEKLESFDKEQEQYLDEREKTMMLNKSNNKLNDHIAKILG